jgi:hypothetical protein
VRFNFRQPLTHNISCRDNDAGTKVFWHSRPVNTLGQLTANGRKAVIDFGWRQTCQQKCTLLKRGSGDYRMNFLMSSSAAKPSAEK